MVELREKIIPFPQLQLMVSHALAILLTRGFVSNVEGTSSFKQYATLCLLSSIIHIPAGALISHVTSLVKG